MRRQSMWEHEPFCCYGAREAEGDIPVDPRLRYKGRTKKKRPVCSEYPTSARLYKRNESLPLNKCIHPYETHRWGNRLSYERSVPVLCYKSTSQNIYRNDESSTETRSFSEASQYTNGMSVDLTSEMAAVTRELEALISYGEKTHAMKLQRHETAGDWRRQMGPDKGRLVEQGRRRVVDEDQRRLVDQGQRGNPEPEKRREPEPEQRGFLEEERPPFDSVQDIPLELLQPRKPAQLRENLAAKAPRVLKNRVDQKPVTDFSQSLLTENLPVQKDIPRGESAEFLKEMLKDLKHRKILTKDTDVGSTVKEIYTNMQFDESNEVKIDMNGMSTIAKSLPKVFQPPTITSVSPKKESSVSTQTQYNYDETLSKTVQTKVFKEMGMGDAEQNALFYNSRHPPKLDKDELISSEKNLSIVRQCLLQPRRMVIPDEQKEFNIYCAQNGLEALKKVKNYDTWLRNKENSEFLEDKEENIGFNKNLETRINKPHQDFLHSLKKYDRINNISENISYKSPESPRNILREKIADIAYDNKNSIIQNERKSSSADFSSTLHTKIPQRNNAQCSKSIEENSVKLSEVHDSRNQNLDIIDRVSNKIRMPIPDACDVPSVRHELPPLKLKTNENTSTYLTHPTVNTVEDQNKGNEKADLKYSSANISERFQQSTSEYAKEHSRPCNNKVNTSDKNPTTMIDDDCKLSISNKNEILKNTNNSASFQSDISTMKDFVKKENLEKLDSSIFLDQLTSIKGLSKTARNYQETEETSSPEKAITDLLKQLRSDLLKHVQTEVKRIEDLNRCLEGVSAENPLKCFTGESSKLDHKFK